MKVGILTLTLVANYGGILQAYALQKTLESYGFESEVLNLKIKQPSIFSMKFIKFLIKKVLFFKYKNPKFIVYFDKNAQNFAKKNIKFSQKIYNSDELKTVFEKGKFDACVVGSDQVFRQRYLMNFKNDFSASFANNATKIAYAASFGLDNANLEKVENLPFHKENIKKFKAISVREKSGIKLCKELFDVDARWVLDPTLLAGKSIYEKFFCDTKAENKIFAYILDKTVKTDEILQTVSKRENLSICEVNDKTNRVSIEEWISSIAKAKCVITDSFHGCVFSIIFNKPFFVFINEARGSARINSLMEMFGLQERIVSDLKGIDFSKEIDYEKVNKILLEQKEISKNFIMKNLKGK